MPFPDPVHERISLLAQDNRSGAVPLTKEAAKILSLLPKTSRAKTLPHFRQEVSQVGKAIIRAQPAMASIVNLVNSALWALEEVEDLATAKEKFRQVLKEFSASFGTKIDEIAAHALPLIPKRATIVTPSFSTTVLLTLLHARRKGRRLSVIVSESRPREEGKDLARRLVQDGIKTTLAVDAALPSLVEQASLVLVGGDALIADPPRLVNKIGTYALALAARDQGVRFYALMGTEKFLPLSYAFFYNPPHDPEEIWPHRPQRLKVEIINVYFDFTPLNLLSAVVTEKGIMSPHRVIHYLGKIPLHPTLSKF